MSGARSWLGARVLAVRERERAGMKRKEGRREREKSEKNPHRILRPLEARVSTTFLTFLPRAEASRRAARVGSSVGVRVRVGVWMDDGG